MGRDPLRTRLTANPSRPPVTAERPHLAGVTRGSSSAFRRIPHDCRFKMGELIVSYRRLVVLVLLLYVFAASRRTSLVSAGDEWLPVSPEELRMTSMSE